VARNTLKNTTEEDIPVEKPKSPKSQKTGRFAAVSEFFKDERVVKIGGLFLIVFGILLFLSCFSYLFSSSHDLRLILDNGEGALPAPYKNWLGAMGAHLAWFFMNHYVGLGAFFLGFMLFLWGSRIFLKRDIIPFWRSIRLSILGMLFFPLLMGFLFFERIPDLDRVIRITCNDNLVGGYGYLATEWTTHVLGWFGTLALLLFVIAAFLLFNFNHQMEALWARVMDAWSRRSEILEMDQPEAEEIQATNNVDVAVPAPGNVLKNVEPVETAADFKVNPPPEVQPIQVQVMEVELPLEPEFNEVIDEDLLDELPEEGSDALLAMHPASPDLSVDDDFAIEINDAVEDEIPEQDAVRQLESLGPYDPRKDLSRYTFPSFDLLKPHGGQGIQIDKEELEENKNRIVETLNHYKIEIAKIKASVGPTVTLYEIVPAPGVRISKIKNLEDDIALSLAALGIRIIAPIPGKGTIGIEVPNSKPDVVSMRSLIASEKFRLAEMELPVVLGKTISNENFVADLAKMPHLLMAGATGQGKSVGLNAILVSLLYKKHPAEIKFVLVDPKKVELTLFNKIERHFLAKLPNEGDAIITDVQKVVRTLASLCIEMDQRYDLLKIAGCRNIKEYNGKFVQRRLNPENGHRYLPYIVLVVDEFADLIMTAGREVETPIARLAQLARAIGIHLIIATQRPSVNIITGTIKANFPARIAFRVTSRIDSRTILDSGGAEQLIGRGDMLYSTGNDLIRLQCGFVDTPEVEEITDFIGIQQGYSSALLLPEVVDENALEMDSFAAEDRDDLFEEAAKIVVMTQQGSASMLQRKLKLGYNRAGRLVDQLEAAGVIGPFEGSKARKVLIPDDIALEQFLKSIRPNNSF
jgi:DNA segregation ATPase FtsK/SpoIIIE, S-DNA-T family